MRIFVHYLSVLNLLLRFSPSQPEEYLDRFWDALRLSDIEIYISERGWATIEREIESHGGRSAANQTLVELGKVLRVCPFVDLKDARFFAHSYGSNSYEEALEVYSAFLVSADIILSDLPNAFLSFGLTRFVLDSKTELDYLRSARASTSLPLFLLGNFSDVWFLVNARTVGSGTTKPNLSRWFRDNRFEPGWQPIEELLVSYYQPTHRRKVIRRGKLISLSNSKYAGADNVALIISVTNPLHQSNITVEIVSTDVNKLLPDALSVGILDASGDCVEQESAMNKTAIKMEIEGEEFEVFSVVICCYKEVFHRENFVI
jgi:hypothetical protein